MTNGAHFDVFSPLPLGIEPGPVGIESAAAPHAGRVTGEAIALGVTGHTRLEALPCHLAVSREKGRRGIVIAAPQRAPAT